MNKLTRKIWFDENSQPPKDYIWYKNGAFFSYIDKQWKKVYDLTEDDGGAGGYYSGHSTDEVENPKEGDIFVIPDEKIVEDLPATVGTSSISGNQVNTVTITLDRTKTYLLEGGESFDQIQSITKRYVNISGFTITSTIALNEVPTTITETEELIITSLNDINTYDQYLIVSEYVPGATYEYFNGEWVERGDTPLSQLEDVVLKRLEAPITGNTYQPGNVYTVPERLDGTDLLAGLSNANSTRVSTTTINNGLIFTGSYLYICSKSMPIPVPGGSAVSINYDTTITIKGYDYYTLDGTQYTLSVNNGIFTIKDENGNIINNNVLQTPTATVSWSNLTNVCSNLDITESEGTTKLSSYIAIYLYTPARYGFYTSNNTFIDIGTTLTNDISRGDNKLASSGAIYNFGNKLLEKTSRVYNIDASDISNPKEGDISAPESTWETITLEYTETQLNSSNARFYTVPTQYSAVRITNPSTTMVSYYKDENSTGRSLYYSSVTAENTYSFYLTGNSYALNNIQFESKREYPVKEYYDNQWVNRTLTPTPIILTTLPDASITTIEALTAIGITTNDIKKAADGLCTGIKYSHTDPYTSLDYVTLIPVKSAYYDSGNNYRLIFEYGLNSYTCNVDNSTVSVTVTTT